jgi:perosamine synthetase
MTPKHIIYPLNYLSGFATGNAGAAEVVFLEGAKKLLGMPQSGMPVGRARSGIYLLVKTLIRPKARKVLLSPYTIPDVVNMVLFAGGEPVFVDNAPRSTSMDVTKVQKAIDEETAVIMVTHHHTNQTRFAELRAMCQRHNVALIEDCAISLGGSIDGYSVGTQSDGGIFSLSSYKFLNYFWGGLLVCRDANVRQQINSEVSSWPRFEPGEYRSQMFRTAKYDIATQPLVFDFLTAPLLRRRQRRTAEAQVNQQVRLESVELDASLLKRPAAAAFHAWSSKIDDVNRHLHHRRTIAAIYRQLLDEYLVSRTTDSNALDGSCWVNFPIWTGRQDRNRIYRELILSKLDVGLSLYPNVQEHEKFTQIPGESGNVAEMTNSVISLPTHPRVTRKYAEKLARKVRSLL